MASQQQIKAWAGARRNGAATDTRSTIEGVAKVQLIASGYPFLHEGLTVPYLPLRPERKYLPDFVLLTNGIIVETKGWFQTADRQKIKAVKEQYPDLDVRVVFERSASKIGKKSKTTYAAWCHALGIPYADKSIPAAWLTEPPNTKSLAVIAQLQLALLKKKVR